MLDRLIALIRFLAWQKRAERMANFTDQYANGYKYLTGVFFGTLTPFNTSLAAIPNVPYRHVSKDRSNVDWAGGIGFSENQQIFEIWTAPLAGYVPAINDVWADQAGLKWNVLDVKSSDLVSSSGLPVNCLVLAQRVK